MRVFDNRRDAGHSLLAAIRRETLHEPVVLALPRGGVPVAYQVALGLHAPLDVLVVRKLGAPMQPEVAVGAIASGGVRVMNDALLRGMPGLDEAALARIVAREADELARRERAYRGHRPALALAGRDVVLVDDGMATGATMRAAARAVRAMNPGRLLAAVPVAAPDALAALEPLVDRVICLESPAAFAAIGQFYRDFPQTSDDEVRALLDAAAREVAE